MFTHLIHILYAAQDDCIQSLNWRYIPFLIHKVIDLIICYLSRYQCVPTFGQGTIRWFCNNAASMKKLVARDFEDLLQV